MWGLITSERSEWILLVTAEEELEFGEEAGGCELEKKQPNKKDSRLDYWSQEKPLIYLMFSFWKNLTVTRYLFCTSFWGSWLQNINKIFQCISGSRKVIFLWKKNGPVCWRKSLCLLSRFFWLIGSEWTQICISGHKYILGQILQGKLWPKTLFLPSAAEPADGRACYGALHGAENTQQFYT